VEDHEAIQVIDALETGRLFEFSSYHPGVREVLEYNLPTATSCLPPTTPFSPVRMRGGFSRGRSLPRICGSTSPTRASICHRRQGHRRRRGVLAFREPLPTPPGPDMTDRLASLG
jgi:hypothetical protein